MGAPANGVTDDLVFGLWLLAFDFWHSGKNLIHRNQRPKAKAQSPFCTSQAFSLFSQGSTSAKLSAVEEQFELSPEQQAQFKYRTGVRFSSFPVCQRTGDLLTRKKVSYGCPPIYCWQVPN